MKKEVKSLQQGARAGSNLQLAEQWQRILVDLAHRVCATVDPDVRKLQDLLDIRAYVKIKTIPGGEIFV